MKNKNNEFKNQNFELMNASECAEFLGCTLAKIRDYCYRKKIPHFKIGAHVRFSKSEIIEWLETNHRADAA